MSATPLSASADTTPDTLSSELAIASDRVGSESFFAEGRSKDFFQSRDGRNQKVDVIRNWKEDHENSIEKIEHLRPIKCPLTKPCYLANIERIPNHSWKYLQSILTKLVQTRRFLATVWGFMKKVDILDKSMFLVNSFSAIASSLVKISTNWVAGPFHTRRCKVIHISWTARYWEYE